MKSPRAGLARVRVVPPSVDSDGPDACHLASSYGLTPDPWQADVLEGWLGRRRDGRWSAATCGLAVPRQNGKNALLEVRELYGMAILGERILHTAHEVKTARKAFLRIASFFENEREFPELAALLRESPRKTNGQEAIFLTNGGSIEFIARSKGSGRGFTVDVLVCDEAQDLSDDELAALLPTISAAPSGNPQVLVTGTPPDPDKSGHGEVFRRIRADGEGRKDSRLAWTDYGAADGPLPDVDDRSLWPVHNPAMVAGRLAANEVERERSLMSAEKFAAERYGWWGDPTKKRDAAFGPGRWDAVGVQGDPKPRPAAFGLAVSVDRSTGSIGAGAVAEVGGVRRLVGGAVDQRPGTGWLVAEAKRLWNTYRCKIGVTRSASDLIPALEAAGLRVGESLVILRAGDAQDACARIFDSVQDGTFLHAHHDALDESVSGAHRRLTPEGRWVWDRRTSTSDVSMLDAVTAAVWLADLPESPRIPMAAFI